MPGLISDLYILFHWSIYLFFCQYNNILTTIVLWYKSEFRKRDSSGLLWIFRDFVFPYKLKFFYSISVKNAIGNLIGITLNLYLAFSNIIILTVRTLLIQEYGISFHLFVSLQFLSSVFYSFQNIGLFFPSFGRFVPRYFTVFDWLVNGIIF